jgi:hypothetical protein
MNTLYRIYKEIAYRRMAARPAWAHLGLRDRVRLAAWVVLLRKNGLV